MKLLINLKDKMVKEYQNNWKFKLNKSKQILFALALAGTALPSDAPLVRLQYHVESIQEYVEQSSEDILYEKLCVCEPIIKHVHHEKIIHVPVDSKGQIEQKQTFLKENQYRLNKYNRAMFEEIKDMTRKEMNIRNHEILDEILESNFGIEELKTNKLIT